jgi:hypothetical protein
MEEEDPIISIGNRKSSLGIARPRAAIPRRHTMGNIGCERESQSDLSLNCPIGARVRVIDWRNNNLIYS